MTTIVPAQISHDSMNHLSKKVILVTGARGFIGTNLIAHLKDVDCTIIRSTRSPDLLKKHAGRAQFLTHEYNAQLSWSNLPTHPDVVFYLSAQTNVAISNSNTLEDFKTNVEPVVELCDFLTKSSQPAQLIFSGTITQVGTPCIDVVNENCPDEPITFYDFHKLIAETYLKFVSTQTELKTTTLRLPNIYGPGPGSRNSSRGVINSVIRTALINQTITVYNQGEQLRDYLFIADAVHAFLLASKNIEVLNGHSFVLSGGSGHTVADAFRMICDRVYKRLGHRPQLAHDYIRELSPIEKRSYVGNSETFTQKTGWTPLVSLSDGIDLTIDSQLKSE